MTMRIQAVFRWLFSVALVTTLAAQNKTVADLPLEESFRGIAFVSGSVNAGARLGFLVDTGASSSSVSREVAEKLGVPMLHGRASASGNRMLQVEVIPQASIALGDATVAGQVVALPLDTLEPIFGRQIDGIVGGDLMRQYVAEFDYERKHIRFYAREGFRYSGRGAELPLVIHHNIPYVELTVGLPNGQRVHGRFMIDSGAGGSALQIYKPIADRNGWLSGLKTVVETGYGVGGATHHAATRAAEVDIGPYHLARPTVAFTEDYDETRVPPGATGLMGVEILRRFRVTYDYANRHMYLEPNGRLNEPFIRDASGLRLRAAAPEFRRPFVEKVAEDSAAARAGIQPGDVLLAIDAFSADDLPLNQLRALLYAPGEAHQLKLRRKDKTLELMLNTRDLLP